MESLSSSLVANLFSFVESQTGYPRDKLSLDTTLNGDIGLDGEDAEDFFIEFTKRYQIDMSQFRLVRYFGGEGFSAASVLLLPLLLFRRSRAPVGKRQLPLKELAVAIQSGRWPTA